MKREYLTGLGLEKEVVDKIMAEHGKSVQSLQTEKETTAKAAESFKAQIAERDTQLTDLKKSSGDSEKLTTQIADLQEKNKTATKEHEDQLTQVKFDYALNAKLTTDKAKNLKAVKALIDVTKIKIDGENLIGYDEQINPLKKSDAYLFTADTEADPGGGGNPAEPGKPDTSKLNEAELISVWGGTPPKIK